MKKCRGCAETKPLDSYYKHAQMADGHLNFCVSCVKRRVRKHRQENEHVREAGREAAKRPERVLSRTINTSRWRKRHPERYKAQCKLNNAVRDGKIAKPTKCERCGKDCSKPRQLHGHHEDYSLPLNVEWLCARCHCSELRVHV